MSSFFNIPVPEHLSLRPVIILTTLFCNKNTFFCID